MVSLRSSGETFGILNAEAALAGKIVLAFDIAATREAIIASTAVLVQEVSVEVSVQKRV